MTKKLIAKTPIGYAGHLLSRGDNVREYIHDEEFIKLLIEGGHAEEIEVDEQLEVEQSVAEELEHQEPEASETPTPVEEEPELEAQEAPEPEEPATGKKKK
ncbi:hypothetical protein M5X00_17685 [Paenibacillus alvei]|uniref:hypothetical protein n=1 Tax=Paenibacillus alvei TaxID=44250 RepID=UPI0002895A70|nr:hypothetical protein [Paenibacillus alvei]EJW16909.1 hypothetical protein PAV_5c04920 [Paenibacillus alvei DSM 29]EJW19906.1 hypothetical protein PAV_1c08940 [Paenibacillus alvei DSM 29]MCY9543272.1 hypothetical protein [Paenibacillus alvei]MCY9708471.1 hypothetical protein [Paenibacillus alvei]MCY9732194.1 hypothetical protein [Paenibacillus alvei]